ncbi:Gmad2 immunoglobulin-like domain-containing protein [Streptomyces sp. CC228A]|uniref:Gmad2 immunoglobulin-like domain-containing protein n=1 Tax=Streptomyces sp. CC228A TaxID=2898186 RepID=UPI001F36CD03|nr:Gmad2 immunoglobulin-like domain-containing protein [Streptomyces sp. CC228A]
MTHAPLRRFRRLRPTALAAVLVVPLALTACGTGGDGRAAGGPSPASPSPASTPASPSASRTADPAATPTARPPTAGTPAASHSPGGGAEKVGVAVYFLHGEQVSPAPRTVRGPDTAAGALRALLSGPNGFERGHDRSTAIPSGTTLNSVVVRDRVATVDLSDRYDDGGGSLSMRSRLAQVVFTVTRFPSVDTVRFALDGKPVKAFGGEGVVLDRPVGRADFEDLTPDILVESPMIGETVRSPVRVWGSANTFEATVRFKVTDVAGAVVADLYGTASSGSGTRGTYDLTVPYRSAAAGAGTLTAFWDSPEDGRAMVSDTVPVRLAG